MQGGTPGCAGSQSRHALHGTRVGATSPTVATDISVCVAGETTGFRAALCPASHRGPRRHPLARLGAACHSRHRVVSSGIADRQYLAGRRDALCYGIVIRATIAFIALCCYGNGNRATARRRCRVGGGGRPAWLAP